MSQNGWCIETGQLSKVFGTFTAVDRIDLCVPTGSVYGFLGPNGAGKSTTIKILTGLIAPSAGKARVLGHDFFAEPLVVKQRIGVVPEDLCLYDSLTAREYLTFIGRMYRLPKAQIETRREELLEMLGLSDTDKTYILDFSHGMRKKLALAAAIIHDPALLFLDEPFEGVDPIAARTIRAALEQMVKRGATVFITSHVLEIVERLCTHVGIIHKGKLVVQGEMGNLAQGLSLEDLFVQAVGETGYSEVALSWLGSAADA